jgi:hypothetical protein
VEYTILQETKRVMGVECVVLRDRVWLNGELIEDTVDWHAQDKEGNVWYFGEYTKEYENGKVVSTEGSFEAGKDGALPGIIMPANPGTQVLRAGRRAHRRDQDYGTGGEDRAHRPRERMSARRGVE